ncbi:hypothetical protein AAFF_G00432720 [Aldrovandia affinis]|uniref:Uncharacterized protein n=1 Tax=Aldrovandia affinis TaxID=143900 RepID=A0AAD7S8I5_9TELE|nr:hypothetical protein AAFF_G00432720 [Aldrovandia affinis]
MGPGTRASEREQRVAPRMRSVRHDCGRAITARTIVFTRSQTVRQRGIAEDKLSVENSEDTDLTVLLTRMIMV